MRGCATPAIRCSPGRAVGPRAFSGPAPVAASRGRPPPGTISDPPWFPHPSPFVWPFCKTRKRSHGQRDEPRKVFLIRSSQSSRVTGVACKRRQYVHVTQHSLCVDEINGHAVRNQSDRFLKGIDRFFLYRSL